MDAVFFDNMPKVVKGVLGEDALLEANICSVAGRLLAGEVDAHLGPWMPPRCRRCRQTRTIVRGAHRP